jgi:hypothetical protein
VFVFLRYKMTDEKKKGKMQTKTWVKISRVP